MNAMYILFKNTGLMDIKTLKTLIAEQNIINKNTGHKFLNDLKAHTIVNDKNENTVTMKAWLYEQIQEGERMFLAAEERGPSSIMVFFSPKMS